MTRNATTLLAGCVLTMAGWACQASDEGSESAAGAAASGAGGAAMVAGGSSGASATSGAGGAGASGGAAGDGMNGGAAGTVAGAMAGAGATTGGVGGSSGEAGTMPIDPGDFDYAGADVTLTETLVIPAGETVRVGPGTTFTASAGVKVHVLGTLIVAGSADAKVQFLGAGTPRSWEGIEIASGGRLELTHAEIGGATLGIHALAGSSYAVSYCEIGTSFKVAALFSDGTFDHCRLHASGDDTFSPINEVSVEDVNGTMTIIDASPTVTHTSFDNSSPLVDMIRIGGSGSPVFEHVSIEGAHCGFHVNGGVNNEPVIRHSVMKGMSYAIMAYTSKARFENNNFIGNSADVGFCFGATADNAVTLTGNHYSAGAASFDPTCFEITSADPSPAATAHPDAGPMGL